MANNNPFKQEGNRELFTDPGPLQKAEGNNRAIEPSSVAITRPTAENERLFRKQAADERFLAQLEKLDSLDWDKMPVSTLTLLIMAKPFKQGKDDPDYHMTGPQALIYASVCNHLNADCKRADLKLNPFLNDMWPDVKTMKINVTVEGQRKIAARRGDLGIPEWKQVERPFPEGIAKPMPWMKQDIGMECTYPVGEKTVTCTAWISRWFKPSPMWRENWEHMVKVRSEGLCYEVITGVGISQPHDDRDVATVKPYEESVISSTEFVPVTPEVIR